MSADALFPGLKDLIKLEFRGSRRSLSDTSPTLDFLENLSLYLIGTWELALLGPGFDMFVRTGSSILSRD